MTSRGARIRISKAVDWELICLHTCRRTKKNHKTSYSMSRCSHSSITKARGASKKHIYYTASTLFAAALILHPMLLLLLYTVRYAKRIAQLPAFSSPMLRTQVTNNARGEFLLGESSVWKLPISHHPLISYKQY